MSLASDQWPRRHLINVEQYHRMAEVGLLAPDARVELIEGEIVDMAPIGSDHAGVVNFLLRTLVFAAGDQAVVAVQQPVRLGDQSEPQPDVMLLKPRADLYRQSHPTSADGCYSLKSATRRCGSTAAKKQLCSRGTGSRNF